MNFNIRKAVSEDSISIAAVAIAVWIDAYAVSGMDESYSRYILGRFTESNVADLICNKHIYVAESEFGICGFSTVADEGCGTYEIETMYVLNRFHSNGIGASLLSRIFEDFTGRFWLKCAGFNTRGISFYRRNGFIDTGFVDFMLDGKAYPCVVLEKIT